MINIYLQAPAVVYANDFCIKKRYAFFYFNEQLMYKLALINLRLKGHLQNI